MNIFVVGFPQSFGRKDLGELFETYGTVSSAKVIYNRETNSSRCFGFVEMPDDAEARNAIRKLDQTSIEGKTIKVTDARFKD